MIMSATASGVSSEYEPPEDLESWRDGVKLPGTDQVGRGYNAFEGEYLPDADAMREPLFNLGEYEEDPTLTDQRYYKRERVDVLPRGLGEFTKTEGLTVQEYQRNLAVSAGIEGESAVGVGLLSGAISAQFATSHMQLASAYFLSRHNNIHKATLRLPSGFQNLLTDEARSDLARMPPMDLFDKYGTHFLRSLIIGAQAEFRVTTNTAEVSDDMDIDVAAKMSYEYLTGRVTGEAAAAYRERHRELQRHSHLHLVTRGGKVEYGNGIIEKGSYEQWSESIEGNLAVVALPHTNDPDPSNSNRPLQPIWELPDDDRRREEIEAAFEKYAERFESLPEPTIVPVYAYSTKRPKNGYSVTEPKRWYFSRSRSEMASGGWGLLPEPFFYVSTEPGEGRVPVYRHSAPKPIRYKLSVEQRPGHRWSNETEPVWYAYPPKSGDTPGRVAIFGHTNPNKGHKGVSGWYYNTRDQAHGWDREELSFYADVVKFGE
jgi:hypothetical protein